MLYLLSYSISLEYKSNLAFITSTNSNLISPSNNTTPMRTLSLLHLGSIKFSKYKHYSKASRITTIFYQIRCLKIIINTIVQNRFATLIKNSIITSSNHCTLNENRTRICRMKICCPNH